MPKLPINYSKALIYKICCKDMRIKDIYVGSTTNFDSRKKCHKTRCHNQKDKHYNICVYQFIRDHGGWNNWRMVLVKDFPCNSNLELVKEEQNIIEELEEYCTLNINRTWRSEEYKEEYNKQYLKQYYKDNTEQLKEYKKQYFQNNKEKVYNYMKKYREENKDRIQKQHKKYASQQYNCVCGSTIRLDSKPRHEKTKKHQDFINP